jgi:hypothetical protein
MFRITMIGLVVRLALLADSGICSVSEDREKTSKPP